MPSCGGAEGAQSWSARYEPPTEYPTDEHEEMTPQTLGALREGVVVLGAAAHASAAALSVTSKANARAELAVLGAAAAPIRRGSKVWRGAARKV